MTVVAGQVSFAELMGEMELPRVRPEVIHKGDIAWEIEHTIWVKRFGLTKECDDDTIVRVMVSARKIRFDENPEIEPDGRWLISYATVGGPFHGGCHIYSDRDSLYSRKPKEADLRAWWNMRKGKYAARMAPDVEIIFDASGKGTKCDD